MYSCDTRRFQSSKFFEAASVGESHAVLIIIFPDVFAGDGHPDHAGESHDGFARESCSQAVNEDKMTAAINNVDCEFIPL